MKSSLKKGLAFLGGSAVGIIGANAFLTHEAVAKKPLIINKLFNLLTSSDEVNEYDHSNEYSREKYEEYDNWAKENGAVEYGITSRDGIKLYSYLIPSKTDNDIYVICAHGYRGTKYGDFGAQAQFYHSLGYNVILIDQRTAGKSEGKYIGFGFFESKDLIDWLKFYNEKFDRIKFIVAGISMGGATVCMVSGDEELPENVVCIISDCAYTNANDEIKYCFPHYAKIHVDPFLPMVNLMNRQIAGYSFKMADAVSGVKNAKVPMLFIHGGNDDFVPTKMVYELYGACPTEKDLLIVENAIHAQSFFTNPEVYREKVKEFINKYI